MFRSRGLMEEMPYLSPPVTSCCQTSSSDMPLKLFTATVGAGLGTVVLLLPTDSRETAIPASTTSAASSSSAATTAPRTNLVLFPGGTSVLVSIMVLALLGFLAVPRRLLYEEAPGARREDYPSIRCGARACTSECAPSPAECLLRCPVSCRQRFYGLDNPETAHSQTAAFHERSHARSPRQDSVPSARPVDVLCQPAASRRYREGPTRPALRPGRAAWESLPAS